MNTSRKVNKLAQNVKETESGCVSVILEKRFNNKQHKHLGFFYVSHNGYIPLMHMNKAFIKAPCFMNTFLRRDWEACQH